MKHQDGFTLIEVLVSFVILSGAIILSFESYASGLRTLHQAQDTVDAQAVAQFVLSDALANEQNVSDGKKGQVGQFNWKLSVQTVGTEESPSLRPLAITVQVFDRQGKAVSPAELSTIILPKNSSP
jgi:prepilin-type N-terminal cleavage/methylation domain-containing protein